MDEFRIPRYLDYPKLYPIFPLGETLIAVMPALSLWVYYGGAQGLVGGVIIGFLLRRQLKLFKEKHGKAAIAQHKYWFFPKEIISLNAFPSSEYRKFSG